MKADRCIDVFWRFLERGGRALANVFDIIGPIMIGPSSSHTAGAVRLGLVARAPLGESPARAQVRLHGSFAHTYKGHGPIKP